MPITLTVGRNDVCALREGIEGDGQIDGVYVRGENVEEAVEENSE